MFIELEPNKSLASVITAHRGVCFALRVFSQAVAPFARSVVVQLYIFFLSITVSYNHYK